MKKAQNWLEENYLQQEKELYINEQLEGELDLANFSRLEKIFISYLIDKSKFEIKNQNNSVEIVELVNAQEWLESQEEYNSKEKREKVTKIDIEEKGLEGDLDLGEFGNLKELFCAQNKLTSLKVDKLVELEELVVGDNKLEQLEVVKNTKLRILLCPGNLFTNVKIGKTDYLSEYGGGKTVLSWEEINKEELNRVAGELGIKPELVRNSSSIKEIRGLVTERINKLKEGENNQKPTDLPFDWRQQIADKDKYLRERDERPDIPITEQQWDEDYSKRPKKTELDKIQAELNKIKGLLGQGPNDDLPADWEKQLTAKNNLDEANQKVQNYENDLKTELGLDDSTFPNWKDEIAKLRKRPTSGDLDEVKNDLKIAQDSLKEWTEKTQGKTPDQVAEAIKKAETVDNLQKELDKWKKLGETPEKVEKELKNKSTSTTITPEQQEKIKDYDRLKAQMDKIEEWMEANEGTGWEARVLDLGK